MRVFITAVGSRGDVQPYVALGKGLLAAGHLVTLCTSSSFEPLIAGQGLAYGYMTNALIDLMDSAQGRDAMENTSGLVGGLKTYARLIKEVGPIQREMVRDSWNAARSAGPDLIVYHPKAYWAPYFADRLGVPVVFAPLAPMFVPTVETPNLGFPDWGLGGWYNTLSYRLVLKLTALGTDKYVKDWRKANDVPPRPRGTDILHTRSGSPIPVLHAYSRHVVPIPADWPETSTATGFWFLDSQDDWQPPRDLQAFLDGGAPPVYVGFGSMAGRDPRRLSRIVVEALQAAGARGLLATGWGGMDAAALPDSMMRLEQAPHDRLFPRMAAVVHHGGAGTTAAGLRAGRPTVICPFFGDQSFWGRRVHALGAGAAPLPQKKLALARLAAAISEVTTDPAIRQNAATLGERIRQEDGVGRAVEAIERIADGTR